jgi:AmiR/NasT family two-component response regulator
VDDSRVTDSGAAATRDAPVEGLTVLVADEEPEELRSTARVLTQLGHKVAAYAVSVPQAAERIAEEDPDVSVVAVHDDLDHALDLIDELSASARGPVVAIVEAGRGEFLARAAARGIDGFARSEDPGEVQSAIEVALRRYRQEADLTAQVTQLETALERRAVIERAKGILMERHGIDERAAFSMLRDHARSRGRKVVDVAASIAEGHALLPNRRAADERRRY